MASKATIAAVLNGLAANYGKALDPDLPAIWFVAFADVSDADLNAAVGRVVAREHFFPTVARMRDAMGLNAVAKPDTTAIIARIWSMADYHPQYGTNPPSVATVRETLGDTIGDAYALVGPDRLFANSDVGRDIARREFTQDLTTAAEQGHDVSLPAPIALPQLTSGGAVVFGARPEQRGGGFKRLGDGTV